MKTFVNSDQQAFWDAFCNGPKGVKGNPLIIDGFVSMENERRAHEKEKEEFVL